MSELEGEREKVRASERERGEREREEEQERAKERGGRGGAQAMESKEVASGTVIVKEGDLGDDFFIIQASRRSPPRPPKPAAASPHRPSHVGAVRGTWGRVPCHGCPSRCV